ncbi:hypothetical protein KAU11_02490, partial [Candidatus Babeliales bacterium]|nr:hypothetical protein [Candidatus Babeliales bacterium]
MMKSTKLVWTAQMNWPLGHVKETNELLTYWTNEAVKRGETPWKNSENSVLSQRGDVIKAFRDAVCAALKSGCSIEKLRKMFNEAPQNEKSSKYLACTTYQVWEYVSNKKMLMFLKKYGFAWDKIEVVKSFVQTGNVEMLNFITFGDSDACRINNWSPEHCFG